MRIVFAAFLFGVFTLVTSVSGAAMSGQTAAGGLDLGQFELSGPSLHTVKPANPDCCSLPGSDGAPGIKHCDLNCALAWKPAAPAGLRFRKAAIAAPHRMMIREASYRWLRPPIAA